MWAARLRRGVRVGARLREEARSRHRRRHPDPSRSGDRRHCVPRDGCAGGSGRGGRRRVREAPLGRRGAVSGAGRRQLRDVARSRDPRAGWRRDDDRAQPRRGDRARGPRARDPPLPRRSYRAGRPRRLLRHLRRRRPGLGSAVTRLALWASHARTHIGQHIDLLILGGLAALTLLSRWPYRARMLYNWDAVQFALALREFDIAKHQPHPPGYLLYVALGRLLNMSLADPNLAYVALAMVFSAATTAVVYVLARALYDRTTAVAAASLLAASPLFWFYGAV